MKTAIYFAPLEGVNGYIYRRSFHDRLYADYREALHGDTTVLFKMKELWFCMGNLFTDSHKYLKRARKAAC